MDSWRKGFLHYVPPGKLQRLLTRALGLYLKYLEVPSGLQSLRSKPWPGWAMALFCKTHCLCWGGGMRAGLMWAMSQQKCSWKSWAEDPGWKLEHPSGCSSSARGQPREIRANKTWSTVEKITSNKQWPQLFPEAFIGYFGTHHLSCLFSTASDYTIKVCFVHKNPYQSSSCSSGDFLLPLFSRQLLFPSDSASSADYLSSLQLRFCHVTFYFSNIPRLALSHAVPVVITVSVVLSCKCWHLVLEAMLQSVRSLSNIKLQNF